MKQYNPVTLLSVLFIILTSCTFHAVNWQSSNPPGVNNASFTHFRGKTSDKVNTSKGDQLLLSYKVDVTQGALLLSVEKSRKTLWRKSFSAQRDSATVPLSVTSLGRYKIVMEGKHASGSFALNYRASAPKTIQVKTNKNIELFGLMMQLDAGVSLQNNTDSVVIENKKTTWRNWYAQTWKNYQRYKAFDSSRVMQTYRSYAGTGFSDDSFIGFLLQVDEVPFAKLNAGTDSDAILRFSKTGNLEEARNHAATFLNFLNNFYNDINFAAYLQENKVYYDQIIADVEKNRPAASFLPTMEAFYQKSFNAYRLVPSLNIPTSMGFGKMHNTARTIYNVFGPFSFQSFDAAHLDLGFDYPDRIQGLLVHEFGHSFVNPAIDKVPKTLIDATAYFYTPIEPEMRKQAYVSWSACLYEHFVRAGEVVIAQKQGRNADAEKKLQDDVRAGFIYLPVIVRELEQYDKNRSRYPSYEAVVPSIVEKLKTFNAK